MPPTDITLHYNNNSNNKTTIYNAQQHG